MRFVNRTSNLLNLLDSDLPPRIFMMVNQMAKITGIRIKFMAFPKHDFLSIIS